MLYPTGKRTAATTRLVQEHNVRNFIMFWNSNMVCDYLGRGIYLSYVISSVLEMTPLITRALTPT